MTTDPVDPSPPSADPAPTPDPSGAPPEPVGDRTFTQADVDRIVQDRLARVKAPTDYDELKAKAARLDEIEEANKTELQKLQEQLAERDSTATAAAERAERALRRAAVVAAATRAGAVDPDAVFDLLPGKESLTIGDDDQVQGVAEAVEQLLTAKPYLVGKPAPPAPGGADGGVRGSTPGTITREDLKTMTPDQIDAARQRGELNHLLTGS